VRKSIMALALAALMLLPALPVTNLVTAQEQGVGLLTQIASPGSIVQFYVNLTYLRNALGWVGSDIKIFISADGLGQLSPNDYPLFNNDTIYVAPYNFFVGEIRLPDAGILQQVGVTPDNPYVYIKVWDGQNIAVSPRLLVVFNVSDYLKAKGLLLADPYGPLGTTNKFCFKANLTEINQLADNPIHFNTTDSYIVLVEFISGTVSYTAFNATVSSNTVNNAASQLFNIDANGTYATTNATTGETLFRFNGTLKDFALNTSAAYQTFDLSGIKVDGAVFGVNFKVLRDGDVRNITEPYLYGIDYGTTYTLIKKNTNDTYTVAALSLGYIESVVIFPSVAYDGYTEAGTTVAGQVNPHDTVTLTLKHYPVNNASANVTITIWRLVDGVYTPLTQVLLTNVSFGAGNATVNVTLPDATYGGFPYTFTATVYDITGLPAINATAAAIANIPIKPYIDLYAFNASGDAVLNATATVVAWGDYLLVKGYGFLQEPINVVAINTTTGSPIFDLIELAGFNGTSQVDNITVLSDGTFVAIVKVPADAPVKVNDTVAALAAGATDTDAGVSTSTLTFTLGGNVTKVYVNPTPKIKLEDGTIVACIKLGLAPAYPYPAVWEPEANRILVIEAIGLDANLFQKVNINITNGNISKLLEDIEGNALANLTVTNGYVIVGVDTIVPVPVIPYGPYNVTVYNATTPANNVTNAKGKGVNITGTAAFTDPVSGNYTKQVILLAPMALNVTGYGWPANVTMQWDVPIIQQKNLIIVGINGTGAATTNASGYFVGIIPLALYLSTSGTYEIVIHPENATEINDTLVVVIGQPPALLVKVDTAKTKMVGDKVDIWILVFFADGTLATAENTNVTVTVYAMLDAGLLKIKEGQAKPVEDGLWYCSVEITDDLLKGKDIAVFVEATSVYVKGIPPQTSYDLAAFTVAGVAADTLESIANTTAAINESLASLGNLGEQLAMINEALANITAKLDAIIAAINETSANIAASIASINTTLAGVTEKLNSICDKLDTITTTLEAVAAKVNENAAAIAEVSTKVDQVANEVAAVGNKVDEVSNKIDQLAVDLQNRINELSGKIDQLQNNVQQTLDQIAQNTTATADQAANAAKTWGIINLVVSLIILAAVALVIAKKKP